MLFRVKWDLARILMFLRSGKIKSAMTIGVLALQGDFDAHRLRLEALGAKVVLVKKPEQLDEIDGLVIPGGESGTFLKLLGDDGFEKLKQFVRRSQPSAPAPEPSCSRMKWKIPSKPDWAPSTSASAATPTDASSIAPSAKVASCPDQQESPRSKWSSSAPPRSSASAPAWK